MIVNPINVINLLLATFQTMYLPETDVNRQEILLKESIQKILMDSIYDFNTFEITEESTLHFQEPFKEGESEYVDDEEDWSEEGLPGPSSTCPHPAGEVDFDYKKRAVDYWRSGKKGNLKFSSVQTQFKRLSNLRQLTRWAKQMDDGGTRREKLLHVSTFTLNKLRNAIEAGLIVHDADIQKWALEAWGEQTSNMHFVASAKWLFNFKKAHRIVSRKITKFVSRKTIEDNDSLQKIADDFVRSVKPLISQYGSQNVYNSDQSGFQLEIHSGRTLTDEGTKKVECIAQSISSTTHSYTIQPIISCDGRVLSPLLLVLKEVSGQFGPIVEKTLFSPPNVFLLASKSGKMTSGNNTRDFIFIIPMYAAVIFNDN